MLNTIPREHDISQVKKHIDLFPVTAILGPRQSGKTFLSKQINYAHHFDLENPRDLAKLDQPQLALEDLEGLIIIDEIQRKPNLFELIRYLVDNNPKQKYLILGSASKDLIRQSSESLAGRIGYYYLGGLSLSDVTPGNLKNLWLKGGFPRAFLTNTPEESFLWLSNYVTTFLERDIPQLGINIPANTLRRFWTMISHYHAQILNYSELGRSFGISDVTVRKYIDILQGTFMLRILKPWHANLKKRTVKSPKIYLRDSGLFHTLMSIENMDQLISHNKLGASWEGFALECVIKGLGKTDDDFYFWNTHSGAELDLFWQSEGKNWGVEFKYADAPKLTPSMKIALNDLQLEHLWIVYPGKDSYTLADNISTLPITQTPSIDRQFT